MLHALRRRVDDDRGFTLIELLVVVIIMGILTAIAIPVMLNQRERARERAVMSDVRNAAIVLTEIGAEDSSYEAAVSLEGAPYTETTTITSDSGTTYTLYVSLGVQLGVATVDGGAAFTITGTHEALNGIWTLDSRSGLINLSFEP